MKKHTIKFTAELLVPLAAFAVATISILTDTKWFSSNQLSTFGIILVTFSALTLIAGILLAFVNRKQLAQDSQDRAAIEKLAHQSIHDNIVKILWPLIHAVDGYSDKLGKLPSVKIKYPNDFMQPAAMTRLKELDLFADSNAYGYADSSFPAYPRSWGTLIEGAACDGGTGLKETLTIYVSYLKPSLIHDLTLLLHSEFYRRLIDCVDHMRSNIPYRTEPYELEFFHPMMEHCFEPFLGLVEKIMAQLEWDKTGFDDNESRLPLYTHYYERDIRLTLRSSGTGEKPPAP